MVRSDFGNKSTFADPFFEEAEIPEVDGSREMAFPISSKLPVITVYGGREFHGDCRFDERFGQGISQLHSTKSQSSGSYSGTFEGISGTSAYVAATVAGCGIIQRG